ncbi:MAG: metal-binding protein [Clostridia bacterium]|nr:metal-binding protein [Clostridia bacterium]
MKNCFSFFKNENCEYFPCHKVHDSENFNCIFCFCPLYHLENCGGNYTVNERHIKDCSNCLLPHKPENYSFITDKLKK